MARKRTALWIIWRKGRAYGDFRTCSDVGGSREALSPPGTNWGTTDPDPAEGLFQDRWEELREKRKGNVTGRSAKRTALDELIRDHLKKKAKTGKTAAAHAAGEDDAVRAAHVTRRPVTARQVKLQSPATP